MKRLGTVAVAALVWAALLGVCGCLPSNRRVADEQKEPHFLAGKSRANALDYKGAMEEFEKALAVNPRNASAHFELALLCERDDADLPGAIYHFDRYLRLRPNAENADIVKDRLLRCKQALASGVLPVSPPPNMQRELEQLAAENRDLKRKIEALQAARATPSQPSAGTPAATGPAQTAPGTVVSPGAPGPAAATAQASGQPTRPTAGRDGLPASRTSTDERASRIRTHTVQPGESPYSIAKKYGVKLDALLAANPDIEPRRLKVGQTLTIPSPQP